MRRVDNNGHIEFDASTELEQAEYQIGQILALYNPAHPSTLDMVRDVLRWYGGEIDRAWSSEYTDRTLHDAQQGTGTMLAAILAGMHLKEDANG